MGLFHFLIVLQGIIAASLVGVILMQRSEGGGLGAGSPSGLMSARGAADFMTRTTSILASLFILLSISLAFVAAQQGTTRKLDESLKRTDAPVAATPAAASKGEGTNGAVGKASSAPALAPKTSDTLPVQ